MMEDVMEAYIKDVQLDYRRLWLEDAHALGLIAELLADALDWQPEQDQWLPDPLALAEAAAQRIRQLEAPTAARRIANFEQYIFKHLTAEHN